MMPYVVAPAKELVKKQRVFFQRKGLKFFSVLIAM